MLTLVLDTSSAAVTAALADDDVVRAHETVLGARSHGEQLAPLIEACLAQVGAIPSDLGAIVAGVGPGPFTGLRVGLVTAGVLGDTLGIPTYPVCSLDGIAAPEEPALLVAADARRREVYWARYEHGVRIAGPDVGRAAELDLTGVTAMTGEGARLYADVLALPLREERYPDPARLLACAADRIAAGAPPEPLIPLYLRRPDAVEPGTAKAVSQ